MRGFLALTFLLCAFQALAAQTITNVVTVVDSLRAKRLLVLSSVDGRVYKTDSTNVMKTYLESLRGRTVSINFSEVNGEAFINSITPDDARGEDVDFFTRNERRDLAPTDVGGMEQVQRLFGLQNDGDKSRSQCFKRAHMWAYDMWVREGIIGQKIFIFYSKRYIQLEEFDWWFHVAPVVTSAGTEYVMDKTFLDKPVTIPEWKQKFMKASVTCAMIEKYDQYESRPWNRLCFMMKTPMWYFRPADIRARDYNGIEKNNWAIMELQDSRRAFKDSEEKYEALDTGKRTVTH
jgi:hypothetical protein